MEEQWYLQNTGQNGTFVVTTPPPLTHSNPWDISSTDYGVSGVDIGLKKALEINDPVDDGVVIAIIDTGVNYNLAELTASLWINSGETPNGIDSDNNGYIDDIHGMFYETTSQGNPDTFISSGDPMDGNGHGTYLNSVIGAARNNDNGIVGIAPTAKLLNCKIWDDAGDHGPYFYNDVIEAFRYALENGASIINGSWVFRASQDNFDYYYFWQQLAEWAREEGALCVFGAGNNAIDIDEMDSLNRWVLPAAVSVKDFPEQGDWDNVISVAAIDRKGDLATLHPSLSTFFYQGTLGSNWGHERVDIAAPGGGIAVLDLNGDLKFVSGTSIAAPIIAGVLNLLFQRFPDDTPQEIRHRCLSSVVWTSDLHLKVYGSGYVNLQRAYSIFSLYPTFTGTSTRLVSWFGSVDDSDYPWCYNISLKDFYVDPDAIDKEEFSVYFP